MRRRGKSQEREKDGEVGRVKEKEREGERGEAKREKQKLAPVCGQTDNKVIRP